MWFIQTLARVVETALQVKALTSNSKQRRKKKTLRLVYSGDFTIWPDTNASETISDVYSLKRVNVYYIWCAMIPPKQRFKHKGQQNRPHMCGKKLRHKTHRLMDISEDSACVYFSQIKCEI